MKRRAQSPLMVDLRNQIVAELATREMTRTALARELGFNPSYISNALNGNVNMTPRLAEKIAAVLDCEIKAELR